MPDPQSGGTDDHRVWMEIRSLRISFDDALSSALRFAPEPRTSAIDDVARRAERILGMIQSRSAALERPDVTEAVRLLELHIDEQLLVARQAVGSSASAGDRR